MADAIPLRRPPDADAPPAPPVDAPLVADAKRLSRLLAVGLRTIRAWDAAGKVPAPIRVGGKVLWRLDEIKSWIAAGAPDRDAWTALRAGRR